MTFPGGFDSAGQPGGDIYSATLAETARGGSHLMGQLVNAVRRSLSERESSSRDFRDRDGLLESRRLLDKFAGELCTQYPDELLAAFTDTGVPDAANLIAASEVRFDQLELMDESQVNESVEIARSQQVAMLASDVALADLNTMICAAQGLKTVRPERNPLRPEMYVKALQAVVSHTKVPSAVRLDWLRHMCAALGAELSTLYADLSQQLRAQGVVGAGYAMLQTPGGGPVGAIRPFQASAAGSGRASGESGQVAANAAGSAVRPIGGSTRRTTGPRSQDESVLTLDKLRRLLSGELDGQSVTKAPETFSEKFAREFDSAPDSFDTNSSATPEFQATVPAAFEALKEMRQVDQVMQRIEKRNALDVSDAATRPGQADLVRHQMRQMAHGLGQSLSLEVVALMIENIARDPRLLAPITQLVRGLEAPLLRLALVDPRFFSDKAHPARRLLQEITHRSLAYESEETRGFAAFLDPLKQALKPLESVQINNAEPFELVLSGLVEIWDERGRQDRQQIEKAVEALRNAEARNLMAETLAAEIRARPDAELVSPKIIDFLCGPWAQVVAQARITDKTAASDPEKYVELIAALLWSAQPELTRKNVSELTRLVPKLLAKLREGLDTIRYPTVKTSAFFETLMNLHQQAFRPVSQVVTSEPDAVSTAGLLLALRNDDDPWVAPVEAKASGFMEMMPSVTPAQANERATVGASDRALEPSGHVPATQLQAAVVQQVTHEGMAPPADTAMPIGAWLELQVNGRWTRTQLTWASPHGTLFLFTSAFGTTQSMTRRLRDKLFIAGNLRLISGQPLVDGALDAVAQTAMRNSVDSVIGPLGDVRP